MDSLAGDVAHIHYTNRLSNKYYGNFEHQREKGQDIPTSRLRIDLMNAKRGSRLEQSTDRSNEKLANQKTRYSATFGI
jgi:hypothetical protein